MIMIMIIVQIYFLVLFILLAAWTFYRGMGHPGLDQWDTYSVQESIVLLSTIWPLALAVTIISLPFYLIYQLGKLFKTKDKP